MARKEPFGRPTKYNEEMLIKANEYIESCVDEYEEFHKTRGEKSDSYDRLVRVNLPTMPGLAMHLGVRKSTLYEWAKIYPDFSDALEYLIEKQEQMLMKGGMSGDYNPVIAKLVLASNHGYREKTDVTTDGKAINISFDNSFNE